MLHDTSSEEEEADEESLPAPSPSDFRATAQTINNAGGSSYTHIPSGRSSDASGSPTAPARASRTSGATASTSTGAPGSPAGSRYSGAAWVTPQGSSELGSRGRSRSRSRSPVRVVFQREMALQVPPDLVDETVDAIVHMQPLPGGAGRAASVGDSHACVPWCGGRWWCVQGQGQGHGGMSTQQVT